MQNKNSGNAKLAERVEILSKVLSSAKKYRNAGENHADETKADSLLDQLNNEN